MKILGDREMRKSKLTIGQKIALDHFLVSYPDSCTFEKITSLIYSRDEKITEWAPFEMLYAISASHFVEIICSLVDKIDGAIAEAKGEDYSSYSEQACLDKAIKKDK